MMPNGILSTRLAEIQSELARLRPLKSSGVRTTIKPSGTLRSAPRRDWQESEPSITTPQQPAKWA
jgi:hypothetical protein